MRFRFSVLILVCILVPSITRAADGVLYMSPARGTYTIGDVFEVDVRVRTDGEAANAAEADIVFNPAALSVESISTEGSVLSLWPTPATFSNEKGTIRFSGTATGSFNAENAHLVTIRFRANSVLPGDIHFDSGALLLNEARATNIITSMSSALYTIVARQEPPAPAPADLSPVVADNTPEVPEVKGVSIQVPTISGYDDRVSIGERIVLQGSAAPNATMWIYLQYENDAPKESSVQTTSNGSFTYVSSEPAEKGMYRAWAEAHTETESFQSNTAVIAARSDGFAAAAESIGPMLGFALPYLVLLIAAGVSLGYFYNRKSRTGTTRAF